MALLGWCGLCRPHQVTHHWGGCSGGIWHSSGWCSVLQRTTIQTCSCHLKRACWYSACMPRVLARFGDQIYFSQQAHWLNPEFGLCQILVSVSVWSLLDLGVWLQLLFEYQSPANCGTAVCCRNLTALNKKSLYRKTSSENLLLDSRCWFLLCIFLTCQLFINYVFK